MPDEKKTREQKQAEKVDKFTKEKQAELEKAGLYKPIDIGPMGEERQKRINEEVLKGVEGEVRSSLEKIQSLRTAPKVEVPEMPSDKYTIQDVRRERRAKIGDILTNFAQGSRGQTVTPRAYQNKLREERNAPYEQYKQTSEAAKKTLLDWENNYIDEQLDYINSKLKNPKISPSEKKQLEILDQKLRLAKAQSLKAEREADLVGKPKPQTTDTPEARLVQETGEGSRVTRDITIEEAKKLEQEGKIKEATKLVDLQLKQARKALADMGDEGTGRLEFIDKKKRSELENKISTLEEERKSILEKFNVSEKPEQPTSTGNPFQDILNKNK